MNNFSRAVPKPIKETAPDEHELTIKAKGGSHGAVRALVNILHGLGYVTSGRVFNKANGEVEQTITVSVKQLAGRYEDRPEQPFEDKSGWVYLFRSRLKIGRYKIGVGLDVQRRLGQVNRAWEEDFERIHSIYSDDAYALEKALHKKYEAVREEGEKEIFWLTDVMVDEIRAK